MLSGTCTLSTRPLSWTLRASRRQAQHVTVARSAGTSGRGRGRKVTNRGGASVDVLDKPASTADQEAAARREALGQSFREAQAAKLAQQAAARREAAAQAAARRESADLRESTDKLQRDLNQAVDQAAFKTSKTEFQVDKVSQSAADSVADVIESVKKSAGDAPYNFQIAISVAIQ
eukprot:jgi/Astpho2/2099/fgenesh1_pg.00038_%23_163_t